MSRTDRIERWLSLAVGIAAICTVAVSLYQTSLARRQLRASAWPYLTQSNSFPPGERYLRTVSNQGIGPAKVRSFRVLVDGKGVKEWNEAVRLLTGGGEPALVYSSFGRGTVLPAGATRELLALPAGARSQTFWLRGQTRMRTVACYCSVYDECWIADSEVSDPTPVKACAEGGAGEFAQ